MIKITLAASLGVITGDLLVNTFYPHPYLVVKDEVFQQPVVCYLAAEQQALAPQTGNTRIAVTGVIYRDSATGRPVEVRNISAIQPIAQAGLGGYRSARGAIPWQPGDEPAEVTIRRMRDGG